MFITHFTGAPHCNDFSLASDDPSVPPFNSNFVEHYRLGRCKLTQVRHEAVVQSISSDDAEGRFQQSASYCMQSWLTHVNRDL